MKYSFPAAYGTAQRIIIVDEALVPVVAGALWAVCEPGKWASYQDYLRAYAAIAGMLAGMMPMNELIRSMDRVYMAVRQLSAGEAFVADGQGLPPALPVVPPALAAGSVPGLLPGLRELQGLQSPGLFGIGEDYASLADVWRALQPATQEQVDTWADKLDLLGDAGDVGGLWDVFRGTVVDGALAAEGGGLLATLLIGVGTLAATMGVQAGQMDTLLARIDRLVSSLDGGATPAAGGSVFGRLEAIEAAIPVVPDLTAMGADVANISDVVGVPTDCDAGYSILRLLCRVDDEIVGGKSGAGPTAPEVSCYGAEGHAYKMMSTWDSTLDFEGQTDTTWYLSGLALPVGAAGAVLSVPGGSGQFTYTTEAFVPAEAYSLCISWVAGTATGGLNLEERDDATGELLAFTPLSSVNGANTDSHMVYVAAGSRYSVVATQQYAPANVAPDCVVWLIFGALGGAS